MGLFSKRPAPEPIVHAPVERTVLVRATGPAVAAHLDDYSSLFSPKHATEHTVAVASAGDWTAIRLPDAVHPWQLHNLAFWMLDCEGADQQVIACSGPSPTHPGYRLVRDPDVDDALCGWDDDGAGWSVLVPGNDIVRPEPVPVPQALTVPSGFHDWRHVAVRLEDPGHDMNPANAPTVADRRRLAEVIDVLTWSP